MMKACVSLFVFALVTISQANLLNRQPVTRSNVDDEYMMDLLYQQQQQNTPSWQGQPSAVPVVDTENRFGAYGVGAAGAHAGAAGGGYLGGHVGGHLGGHVGGHVGGHIGGHVGGHVGAAAAAAAAAGGGGYGGYGSRFSNANANANANSYSGYGR